MEGIATFRKPYWIKSINIIHKIMKSKNTMILRIRVFDVMLLFIIQIIMININTSAKLINNVEKGEDLKKKRLFFVQFINF